MAPPVLIIADENIPCVREAFGGLGDVRTMPGRAMTRAAIGEAEALLVRSVTRVNEALLAGTRVRFVGTATAGIDHVDTEGLRGAGITFASAAGSNAESVAQYVAAALAELLPALGKFAGKSIGIVGVGHCGSRVERIARALEMAPVLCDPPLARATNDAKFRPLSELRDCDVLTLHTPLIFEGDDRTVGMIDAEFLKNLRPGAIVINAARGGIVDERALIERLDAKHVAAAVVDAWENEPEISIELLKRARIATPHIAGYSLDGKIRGTMMIYHALCDFLGAPKTWTSRSVLPPKIATLTTPASNDLGIAQLFHEAYPIMRDDAAMRKMEGMKPEDRPAYFDSLRKHYPIRREFNAYRINPGKGAPEKKLRALGFEVDCS